MSDAPADARDGLVLVTGASGFVGSAVANALRARGWRLRVLLRETASRVNIDPRDEIAVGDLRDRESVRRAIAGARYLFHVAADYRLWARDPSEIYSANIEGARNVMEEALRAGVERIVHTSSVATLARANGDLAAETDRLAPDRAIGAYKHSKVAVERFVEDLAEKRGLPVVIVNPSTPIGPRDVRPTPTGRIIVEAASGRMPAFVETGLNFAHVDDVAEGHVAAFERGRTGERYILGGDNVPLSDLLAEIARLVGRRGHAVRLPHGFVYPFAVCAELAANVTGREPFATRDGLKMARDYMYYSDEKARRELGYVSRPWRTGAADAVDWFRQAGYLKR